MSLALADLQTWLAAQISAPVEINRLPDQPAEVVVVTHAGGTTPILEGAFEGSHILVRCRASTDATAEALALEVHGILSAQKTSFQMGSTYVLSEVPATGPPAYAGRDVDKRTIYTTSYLFTAQV